MKRKFTKQTLLYWNYHKQGIIPTAIFQQHSAPFFLQFYFPNYSQLETHINAVNIFFTRVPPE
jgi:hypothetical protein